VDDRRDHLSATITRPVTGLSADIARAFENVVQEVLATSPDACEVQFGTWPCEDGRVQVVCRVETAPATPFGGELQWRWWSPLLEGPEDLRAVLSAAVQARQRRLGAPSAVANPPAAISAC
jgi:hypothetical protein